MHIRPLQTLYRGFEIKEAAGNNAFSYAQRKNKSIWVPGLIHGTPWDLEMGEKIVFSEIEDGIEKNHSGLRNFVYFSFQEKDIFIFDNHNHAFFFWMAAYGQGKIKPGRTLVHVDQHSDMREPAQYPGFSLKNKEDLQAVFDYTNYHLNVGCFIQPALKVGLFSEVQIIDSSASFGNSIPEKFILDIDMDIFSDAMAYIDNALKVDKIRQYMQAANFITIATSPYFMDQKKALSLIRELFK